MPDKASIASVMRAMGRVTQDLTRENRRCMLNIDPESSSAEVHLLSDPEKNGTQLAGVFNIYSWQNPESQAYKR